MFKLVCVLAMLAANALAVTCTLATPKGSWGMSMYGDVPGKIAGVKKLSQVPARLVGHVQLDGKGGGTLEIHIAALVGGAEFKLSTGTFYHNLTYTMSNTTACSYTLSWTDATTQEQDQVLGLLDTNQGAPSSKMATRVEALTEMDLSKRYV